MEITQIHSFIYVYTDINTQSQLRIDTNTYTRGKCISSNHYQLELLLLLLMLPGMPSCLEIYSFFYSIISKSPSKLMIKCKENSKEKKKTFTTLRWDGMGWHSTARPQLQSQSPIESQFRSFRLGQADEEMKKEILVYKYNFVKLSKLSNYNEQITI